MMRHRSNAPSAQRLSELDALRGIAAFLVLIQHLRYMGLDPRPFASPPLQQMADMLMNGSPLRVLELGRSAVLFFFVLSGYVLTRALLRNGSPGLPAFAAQRTIRLMLPAAASVLLSAGLYAAVVTDPALLAGELRDNTLYLWRATPELPDIVRASLLLHVGSNRVELNLVLWSLVHEWRLTLLLPLVLLLRGRIWWLLTLGCVGMAIGAMHHIGQENRIQLGREIQHTVTASLYFGLAVASGAALAMRGPVPSLERGQRIAGAIAAVALFGLASDIAVYAASVLLIVLAQQPGAFQATLRRAPLLWLGRVSYSLYLVHVPLLVASVVLLHGTVPLWACLLLGAAVSLPAAEAMHRLVEAPSRDLARWAERRLSRPHARGGQAVRQTGAAAGWDQTWAGEGGLFLDPGSPR
jgi:peptidoglycan/LPS O-acetylase OafA/YrhL